MKTSKYLEMLLDLMKLYYANANQSQIRLPFRGCNR